MILATERDVAKEYVWPDTQCRLAVEERPLIEETKRPDVALQILTDRLYPPINLGCGMVEIRGN